ncbi:MAG: lipopolysaccharide assembly protein LapA domain-containing protein [Spirochaetaceae bacterium]
MLRFILGIVFGIVALVFMLQNTEVANVEFLPWTFSLPRAMMYFILLVVGFVLGWLVTSIRGMRQRRKKK